MLSLEESLAEAMDAPMSPDNASFESAGCPDSISTAVDPASSAHTFATTTGWPTASNRGDFLQGGMAFVTREVEPGYHQAIESGTGGDPGCVGLQSIGLGAPAQTIPASTATGRSGLSISGPTGDSSHASCAAGSQQHDSVLSGSPGALLNIQLPDMPFVQITTPQPLRVDGAQGLLCSGPNTPVDALSKEEYVQDCMRAVQADYLKRHAETVRQSSDYVAQAVTHVQEQ